MPIYEYKCLRCNSTFEKKRMITEMDYMLICPDCKSNESRRIFPTSFSYLRETNQDNEHVGDRIPDALIEDCSFTNVGTGIKTGGDAYITGNNLRMHNVRTVAEATENSNIRITNLNAKRKDN
jgi:putative FmdB family regulatory protein